MTAANSKLRESIYHIEALRFYVQSRSRCELRHLVDLEDGEPVGRCSCEDWEFRISPALEAMRASGERVYCAHIAAARDWLVDEVIRRRKAALPEGKP